MFAQPFWGASRVSRHSAARAPEHQKTRETSIKRGNYRTRATWASQNHSSSMLQSHRGAQAGSSRVLLSHRDARKSCSSTLLSHKGAPRCSSSLPLSHRGAPNCCSSMPLSHTGAQNRCSGRVLCHPTLKVAFKEAVQRNYSKKLCSVTLHSVSLNSLSLFLCMYMHRFTLVCISYTLRVTRRPRNLVSGLEC